MTLSSDRDDRFGMPESAIQAALEAHEGILRVGMYVPTRGEVATWPANRLYSVLMDWMWESHSEIIPNSRQITEVLAVLEARPDAGELAKVIVACREFLNGE